MQGAEAVVLRLATTVVSALAKSLIAKNPGAGLVRRPGRPARAGRRPERLGEEETARLVGVLARRLAGTGAGAGPSLPEHEQRAAVDAVCDVFSGPDVIDQETLFAADLDPARLRAALLERSPGLPERAGLGEEGTALFGELLDAACSHLVEYVTTLRSFPARTSVELVRRSGEAGRAVEAVRERLGPTPEARALEFEERYGRYVEATHGRLQLFGLTLGCNGAREWPLSTAYITLSMSSEAEHYSLEPTAQPMTVSVSAEQALAGSDRMLLRGPAGSGKSTLMQWLATNAARRSFGQTLGDWNGHVPFVLRLRSFATRESLPLPGEFLAATGNPLAGAAPAGWVEELLTEGRALVLVDGVDEVPSALRQRTREWLRSLLSAFPHARYIVTTRPSAVPEDWLQGQGFTAHSLLPMGREDIRQFIAHWHGAAREECADPRQQQLLDGYERSLQQAVTSRRELGQLATNPLMCALLCALNRDRRMHLPRARKELYDASLDMLLVRRDTEREIAGVEGVDLTRDEQMVLLQRLAYWLIRNGQAEATCAEAIEMIDGWMTAMPHVRAQGDAQAVFNHLLNRSGLLLEPIPGSVNFVHRTFQDYLGSKEAVETRDFGLLVRNAHDDQWDDVVRMAVGHARVEERKRLLRQLLRRAERGKGHRQRLVLLAAACLEHAPELDPALRADVERRTAELLPPRTLNDAEELAKVGALVLELLPGPDGLDEDAAAAVVRTAGLIKGDAAFALISRFKDDARSPVANQMSQAWGSFEAEPYAQEILAFHSWEKSYLRVESEEQLAASRHIPQIHCALVAGPHADLRPLLLTNGLQRLTILDNHTLSDLSALSTNLHLQEVALNRCPELSDLSPLAGPGLASLHLSDVHPGASSEPLRDMPNLRSLSIDHPLFFDRLEELPVGPQLTELRLHPQTRHLSLEGIERWPHLTLLGLTGSMHLQQLSRTTSLTELSDLHLRELSALDLTLVEKFPQLKRLSLWQCNIPNGLAPLRELPNLRSLWLSRCALSGTPIDLSPVADLEKLTICLTDETRVTGEEQIAPERITLLFLLTKPAKKPPSRIPD
ncbi:NACHT domain-containing protein [Streptomyces sp. NPDC050617]|uniref:NACHT domain-containing protein n=1 Tax=Streptomyces sp. NPDC050617 TaxID=3154628 RepID=UPI0034430435